MSYFSKFPLMVYELNSQKSVVKDILRRTSFISEHRPYTDLFTPYTIIDGDTPQSLAKKYYESTFYHWVILMFNEIHSPYFEWPLEQVSLEKMCIDKYGINNLHQTKHFEIDDIVVGEIKEFSQQYTWVPPTFTGLATAVSFYEYEQKLNDSRRIIHIMRPELLGEFTQQFENAIGS